MKKFWAFMTGFMVLAATSIAVPQQASAETISVSQTITVTARVADARSIVVNDKGQMTRIYSNTDKPVMPKVYLNDVPGEQRPLTPELLSQYQSIMSQPGNKIGIAIDVPLPDNGFQLSSIVGKLLAQNNFITANYLW